MRYPIPRTPVTAPLVIAGTACLTLVLSSCGRDAPLEPTIMPGWVLTDGVEVPESIYVDTQSGFIFASQMAGAPAERNGTGRIMKLHGDGTVESTAWITGLNAPKGLRSYDGTLWTTDIDEVVAIDIATGEVVSRIGIDGAQFLNDVAIGPTGTVYVSDMMANRIHAIRDDVTSVFAEGEQLEWPNGLLVDDGRLIVGGWGRPAADFSTEVPGRLYALDLETAQKTSITPEPFANIDGVESDGGGGYVITDWFAGKVFQVSGQGEVRELRQLMQGTADHAFIAGKNLIIIPQMLENRLNAYDLSDDLM